MSGGSDSTALLVLFAQWLASRDSSGLRATVLTIDHGLRAESADEARLVAAQAERLGLSHSTLVWQGESPRQVWRPPRAPRAIACSAST